MFSFLALNRCPCWWQESDVVMKSEFDQHLKALGITKEDLDEELIGDMKKWISQRGLKTIAIATEDGSDDKNERSSSKRPTQRRKRQQRRTVGLIYWYHRTRLLVLIFSLVTWMSLFDKCR